MIVIKDNIITLIEKKRKELHFLVKKKDSIDNNIIKKSQELDLLINKYNQKEI
ncbi:MAG: Spo0E family sporulation regulatory protein-aspartic acid phosphatase [Halothermotrichaceae bacterium]